MLPACTRDRPSAYGSLCPAWAAAAAASGLVICLGLACCCARYGLGTLLLDTCDLVDRFLDLGNRSRCEAWGWTWKKPHVGSPWWLVEDTLVPS